MKWYILALKKYATFSGRARRKEFWMFMLFYYIFLIAGMILDQFIGTDIGPTSGLITSLYSLAMFVPTLAVIARRFHDIGRSAWNYLWFVLAGIVIAVAYVFKIVSMVMSAGMRPEDIDSSMIFQFLAQSMWFLLAGLIVFVIYIIIMAKDSQPGTNKWGPNPKEPEAADLTSFQ